MFFLFDRLTKHKHFVCLQVPVFSFRLIWSLNVCDTMLFTTIAFMPHTTHRSANVFFVCDKNNARQQQIQNTVCWLAAVSTKTSHRRRSSSLRISCVCL